VNKKNKGLSRKELGLKSLEVNTLRDGHGGIVIKMSQDRHREKVDKKHFC
jgi:hypothetical protein